MHHQPDIHTISKTAPPSYAEAMAQNATKENSYAPPYGQPTTTTYDQGCSQMPGYPPSAPANNFYSNIPCQPSFSQSYVQMESSQQCHRATAPAIAVCVAPVEARQDRSCCEHCASCNKRIAIALVFAVLVMYLIKVIAAQ